LLYWLLPVGVVAKNAVGQTVPLSRGRLKKREFCEFINAVIDAMPADAESPDAFLGFLRSKVTVSHSRCVLTGYVM